MTANDAVKRMIHAINQDKLSDFYLVAEDYLKTLATGGSIYWDIKGAIGSKPMKMMMLSELSNDVKKLISTDPEKTEFVYLCPKIKLLIEDMLFEWEHKDVYKAHNLNVRNKLLLHGPTGNGKTTVARNIAKLSKLPFVEVNSDLMIDSHLGVTNQNINKIFNSIKEPCVLFWDEVDSIGKKRGSNANNSAAHENDRMVNSILINIEKLSNDVIFIGATNRMDVLDPAFLRRFDVLHEVSNTTIEEKEMFVQGLFSHHDIPASKIDLSSLENFSRIKDEVIMIARQHVIKHIRKSA